MRLHFLSRMNDLCLMGIICFQKMFWRYWFLHTKSGNRRASCVTNWDTRFAASFGGITSAALVCILQRKSIPSSSSSSNRKSNGDDKWHLLPSWPFRYMQLSTCRVFGVVNIVEACCLYTILYCTLKAKNILPYLQYCSVTDSLTHLCL